jgi:hypothetical protein
MHKSLLLMLLLISLIRCRERPGESLSQTRPERDSRKIYRRERVFVFLTSQYSRQGRLLQQDTLLLTTSPTVWQVDTLQSQCQWSLNSVKRSFIGTTGLIENDTVVWLHPPRNGEFGILEFSPFPMIHYPPKIGTHWKQQLWVPDQWSDAR